MAVYKEHHTYHKSTNTEMELKSIKHNHYSNTLRLGYIDRLDCWLLVNCRMHAYVHPSAFSTLQLFTFKPNAVTHCTHKVLEHPLAWGVLTIEAAQTLTMLRRRTRNSFLWQRAHCVFDNCRWCFGCIRLQCPDERPQRRMVVANHDPQAIIPSFGHVVCPVSVSQSGVVNIPQDRWESHWAVRYYQRDVRRPQWRLSKILQQRTSVLWRNWLQPGQSSGHVSDWQKGYSV